MAAVLLSVAFDSRQLLLIRISFCSQQCSAEAE